MTSPWCLLPKFKPLGEVAAGAWSLWPGTAPNPAAAGAARHRGRHNCFPIPGGPLTVLKITGLTELIGLLGLAGRLQAALPAAGTHGVRSPLLVCRLTPRTLQGREMCRNGIGGGLNGVGLGFGVLLCG